MRKYFIYNKVTKKVTMISDTIIGVDKDIFTTKEITLTPTEFNGCKENSNYLFYNRGLKIILPKKIQEENEKIAKRQEIVTRLENKDTTLEDIKTEIIKLINI